MRALTSIVLWSFLLVAAFAPFLASDRPFIARVEGEIRFPSLSSYLGLEAAAPAGMTWREWWLSLDESSEDWGVMPLWPQGPDEVHQDLFLAGPSEAHPLGNDDTGRDQLSRLVHGALRALTVALGAVCLGMAIGVPLGALAGACGGWVDLLVLRGMEVFLCFPGVLAVIAASAFFGGATWVVILVLGLVYWPAFARIVRGEFLSLREREFVHVARSLGVPGRAVLFRHMLPCIKGQVYVTAAFVAANAIIAESTLSFLSLGRGLTEVSWGAMLAQGKAHAAGPAWHLWVFPAIVLSTVILSLHALADRLSRPAGKQVIS
ncbi:MAG: ABC transporter permease [Planctomycetota bacterium]|jgi:peptide/nickel transport system permease protein